MKYTVTVPFEVEADSPREALTKVPIPEGCREVSIIVQPSVPVGRSPQPANEQGVRGKVAATR